MLYELHLTVAPDTDVAAWQKFCADQTQFDRREVKPLLIELSFGNKQLMFAATHDGTDNSSASWVARLEDTCKVLGFQVIRSKLEIPLDKAAGYKPVYHECHVKALLDPEAVLLLVGRAQMRHNFRPEHWSASRNLLYKSAQGLEKWYFTQRVYGRDYLYAARQFRDAFAELPKDEYNGVFNAVRMESETVIHDSNEGLDEGWCSR